MRIVERQLPQAMFRAPNPVFERELRRVRWIQGIKWVTRVRWLTFAIYAVVLAGLIVARFPLDYIFFRTSRFFALRMLPNITLGMTIVADVYYVFMAVNSINREIQSGELDLLKLTPVQEQDILDAKYSIAQLRAWPVMTLDRVFQLLPLLTVAVFRPVDNASTLLLYILPFMLLSWFGPLWRMRALTAAGLAVSARVQNSAFAMLAGLGVVLGLHLGMLIISNLTAFGMLRILIGPVRVQSYLWFGLLSATLSLIATYSLCRFVQIQALLYALRSAFRPE
jgi:hypothetical protein